MNCDYKDVNRTLSYILFLVLIVKMEVMGGGMELSLRLLPNYVFLIVLLPHLFSIFRIYNERIKINRIESDKAGWQLIPPFPNYSNNYSQSKLIGPSISTPKSCILIGLIPSSK